jgi:hypothetical protein
MQNGRTTTSSSRRHLAGLTLALQLKQRLAKFDVPLPGRRTRCRGRAQGGPRVGRNRRALFRQRAWL